jgi:predicted O-methyltransferase YrrM
MIAADLLAQVHATPGFMPDDEGAALWRAALDVDAPGPIVEIGSYCGRTTLLLADAARRRGTLVVTVDHHRGSEEHQPGWDYHDPSLIDAATGRVDTLPHLRRALAATALEDHAVVVVARSEVAGRLWGVPVRLLFLDGSHVEEQAQADYAAWAPHVAPGGVLAIHDVFPDPADGGQAPFHVLRRALDDGFVPAGETGSLRLLTKPGRTRP